MLEGDFLANPRAWGIEIRTRYGFGLGGSQVYLAPGGATSRFQSWKDREIVQVNINGIACGGGGIHCITQQQPAG